MPFNASRRAITLTELLAVVTLMGVIAAAVLPRVTGQRSAADASVCELNRGYIELQAQLWLRANGSLPAPNLTDIAAQAAYFPEGLPTCPVDGSVYVLDPATGEVSGHAH